MKSHQHTAGSGDSGRSNLGVAFFLNLGFALLEIAGGLLTNSIAILSDAVHDLGDTVSLGLAWYFDRYARKAHDEQYSYGYRRYSLLGALLNAVILIGGSLWVLANAVPRLLNPEETRPAGMLLLALIGVAVNGYAAYRLRHDETLNAQVAGWHLLEDVLGWVAVLIVSVVLLFADLFILDALLSILITLYILVNVVRKLRRTGRLFLQATPENISLADLERRIRSLDRVQDVHHAHLWSLDGEHHVLTAHVVVAPEMSKAAVSDLKRRLAREIRAERFEHVTLEIEFGQDDCHLTQQAAAAERAGRSD